MKISNFQKSKALTQLWNVPSLVMPPSLDVCWLGAQCSSLFQLWSRPLRPNSLHWSLCPYFLWWPRQTNPGENSEKLQVQYSISHNFKLTKQMVLLNVQNCKNFMESSRRISEKFDDTWISSPRSEVKTAQTQWFWIKLLVYLHLIIFLKALKLL